MSHLSFNLLGPQGSGKGTQAKGLVEHFGFRLVDMGETLRNIRELHGELADDIAEYMDHGRRVPPELIAKVTYETLSDIAPDEPILFDGLLRGMDEVEAQKETFEKLEIDWPIIIYLNVDEETALERIARRRICVGCHHRYMIRDEEDIQTCERCGGHLETRHDDTEEAIKERLGWYYKDTVPVLNYFREHGTVIDIDASPSIDEVRAKVVAEVERCYKEKGLRVPTAN